MGRRGRVVAAATTAVAVLAVGGRAPSARAAREGTGTFVGTMSFDGFRRTLALQLHERADGDILGYVVGGTSARTVASGHRDARGLALVVEMRTPGGTSTFSFDARLTSNGFVGTVTRGADVDHVNFKRTTDVLTERRFILAELGSGGEVTGVNEAAVALDGAGVLVAGSWSAGAAGSAGCGRWRCDGEITDFVEVGAALTFGLRADGCSDASSGASLTFGPLPAFGGNGYTGSYVLRTCAGLAAGSVLGARTTRTTSDDAGGILAGVGLFADSFDAGPLSAPNTAVASDYLDWGLTTSDLFLRYNEERTRYSGILTAFNHFTLISTVPDADALARLTPPYTAVFDELHSGVPTGGGSRVTYFEGDAARPLLRFWRHDANGWATIGNQSPPLDLPFESYDWDTSYGRLLVHGTSRDSYASMGPVGVHFEPLTGHLYGKMGYDMEGYFAPDSRVDGVLREVSGYANGNGLCETGEICGVSANSAKALRPWYITPMGGEIVWVSASGILASYVDNEPNLMIGVRYPSGEVLRLAHVGLIEAGLLARLSGAGVDLSDPASLPVDVNLLGTPIPVAARTRIGRPQVIGTDYGPPPGCVSSGCHLYSMGQDGPWAQMEYFFDAELGTNLASASVCAFDYMVPAGKSQVQSILTTEMNNPDSARYRIFHGVEWKWKAEARACMVYSPNPSDFRDLFTNVGGWFERDEAGVVSDEIVSFAPIATDMAVYNPGLYDPGVTMLIARARPRFLMPPPPPFPTSLPDGTAPAGLAMAGEILDRTATSLLVKWRDLAPGWPVVYQRARLSLGPTGLVIAWGNMAATTAGAVLPAALGSCNGTTTVCYDHTFHAGY